MAGIIVLLGGNVEAAPIARRAVELGFYPIVVDIDARCAARGVSGVRFVQASCYHGDRVIAALEAARVKPDGVMCAAIDAPIACAEVAAAFGLPGLSIEAAKLGQDKYAQKQKLNMAHISIPAYATEFWHDEPTTLPTWAGIIKPLDSRGGRGVLRLLLGIDPAFAYEIARANSPTGRVMVEEWLDGPQLSTESFIQNGKVLFTAVGLRNYDRLGEFAPFCVEDGFSEPYDDDRLTVEINTVIKSACHALGWYQQGAGTVKGDLVIHDGRVYVIELACRLSGGFFATHGHELAYGVDFVGAAIKAALGYTLESPAPYARQFVAQRYCFASKDQIGKTIKRIEPLSWSTKPFAELMYTNPFCTYNVHAGEVVEPVTNHTQRLGQALATGNTPDAARLLAEETVKRMMSGLLIE